MLLLIGCSAEDFITKKANDINYMKRSREACYDLKFESKDVVFFAISVAFVISVTIATAAGLYFNSEFMLSSFIPPMKVNGTFTWGSIYFNPSVPRTEACGLVCVGNTGPMFM
jgi:hypothetical protein